MNEYEETYPAVVLQRQEKLAAAKSIDEEWVLRWEIWTDERAAQSPKEELKRAEQPIDPDAPCQKPGDLPLWELEQLRMGLGNKRTAIYEKAYAASLADAQRLCSGRVPFPLGPSKEIVRHDIRERVEELTAKIEGMEQEAAEIRDWIAQLPDGATEAGKLAQKRIDNCADCIDSYKTTRQRRLDKLAQKSSG